MGDGVIGRLQKGREGNGSRLVPTRRASRQVRDSRCFGACGGGVGSVGIQGE